MSQKQIKCSINFSADKHSQSRISGTDSAELSVKFHQVLKEFIQFNSEPPKCYERWTPPVSSKDKTNTVRCVCCNRKAVQKIGIGRLIEPSCARCAGLFMKAWHEIPGAACEEDFPKALDRVRTLIPTQARKPGKKRAYVPKPKAERVAMELV